MGGTVNFEQAPPVGNATIVEYSVNTIQLSKSDGLLRGLANVNTESERRLIISHVIRPPVPKSWESGTIKFV